MSSPTLTSIPGTGDEQKAALEQMLRNMSVLRKFNLMIAELRAEAYHAYIEKGVPPEQAALMASKHMDSA